MASIDIPQKVQRILEKRKERSIERFNNNTRLIKQSFLIICEGENTEPDYFNEFKLGSAKVESVGEGMNTISLVNKAIFLKRDYARKGQVYNQYWVVFDKDDFTNDDFNNAIWLAEATGFQVAYSNQSFELWYLLHYNLHQGAINRSSYPDILTNYLGFPYTKEKEVSEKMTESIYHLTETAIRNAKHIYAEFPDTHPSPAIEESSTTVFKLVEELLKFV
jgi:RloB-like protein